MKHFDCMNPECDWTIERESEDEILEGVAEHARDQHGMDELPPQIEDRVRSLIVET